jgi:hypothetical protein
MKKEESLKTRLAPAEFIANTHLPEALLTLRLPVPVIFALLSSWQIEQVLLFLIWARGLESLIAAVGLWLLLFQLASTRL